MKAITISAFTLLTLCACATGAADRMSEAGAPTTTRRAGDVEIDPMSVQSLADFLVRAPGVYVDERGGYPTVSIRGQRALFVLDGLPIGTSYANAANAVNPRDIARVEVLTGVDVTARYGGLASGGVISIVTRHS